MKSFEVETPRPCTWRLKSSPQSPGSKHRSIMLTMRMNLVLALSLMYFDFVIANPDGESTVEPCEACKSLVRSFEKGMERTMRGKHEGGDTSWEEKNLKSYADSEVRLVEIQEKLCDDLGNEKAKCLATAEEGELDIEEWWFGERKKSVKLIDYLCISKLKRCCPPNSFGPTCQKCSSHCNGHGSCDGSGTRAGTGDCLCASGYHGKECDECTENYYKLITSQLTEKLEFTCLPCHQSCDGGCTGSSSSNCTSCKQGYSRDDVTKACLDINECEVGPNGIELDSKKLCPDGTYCVNTDGHFKCANCHMACATCLGYGRDKCVTCALDHFMDDQHNCVDSSESDPTDETVMDFFSPTKQQFFIKVALMVGMYPLFWRLINGFNQGSAVFRHIAALFISRFVQTLIFPYVYGGIRNLSGRGSDELDRLTQQAHRQTNEF